MNIHFNDIEVKKSLDDNSIVRFIVGSKLYKTNNKNSDTDYLSIFLNPTFSFYWENHQLQFKDTNIDYNYSELRGFIRNLLTGDSTINLEILFSEQDFGELSFLKDFKFDFINFNIIRSYLGMARRDLKKYVSTKENKKLAHSIRGYIFAYQLFYKKDLDVKMNTNFYSKEIIDKELYMQIKNGYKISKSELEKRISKLRNAINSAYEKGNLNRMMKVERLKELDETIKSFYKSKNIKSIEYGNLFYDVLENGIQY